ncbi:hypothetical protein UB45_05640 [Terrabacter sp. 28]|nr:hypothetical protein UB45_05640 [Terrabacter sp. 28]
MQAEEAGRREEGERHVHDAHVAAPHRRGTRPVCRHRAEHGRAEHQPEVRRVVLPLVVESARGSQHAESDEWEHEGDGTEGQAATRPPGCCGGARSAGRGGCSRAACGVLSHAPRPPSTRGTGAPPTRRPSPRRRPRRRA